MDRSVTTGREITCAVCQEHCTEPNKRLPCLDSLLCPGGIAGHRMCIYVNGSPYLINSLACHNYTAQTLLPTFHQEHYTSRVAP